MQVVLQTIRDLRLGDVKHGSSPFCIVIVESGIRYAVSYASHHFYVCFFAGAAPLIPRTEPFIGAMVFNRFTTLLYYLHLLLSLAYSFVVLVLVTVQCDYPSYLHRTLHIHKWYLRRTDSSWQPKS